MKRLCDNILHTARIKCSRDPEGFSKQTFRKRKNKTRTSTSKSDRHFNFLS